MKKESLKKFFKFDFGKIIVFVFLLIVFNLIIMYKLSPCMKAPTMGFFCQYYKLPQLAKLGVVFIYLFLLYTITCLIKLLIQKAK